jgi:acetylornithine deacetylase/succinyl-diaminopimelate desuccinylase-like protein
MHFPDQPEIHMGTDNVQKYIDDNRDRFMTELFEFLRIPSISANSEFKHEVRRTADWVAQQMRAAGLEVSQHDTPGHPVVLGEWRNAGADAPTVLIYGHYDVQPPEPLDLWTSPPFQPEIRDGRIYARGSVDDKGQLYLHIKAVEAHLKTNGKLPVNVILLAEGEEEIGSANLMPFVEQNRDRLKCDAIVISDTTMAAPGLPTIGASLRGLAYFEIHVQGSRGDLHSGSYGGAVLNPATALAHIIASFHDDDWHIAIDGFYDDVDAAPEFRESIRRVPVKDQSFLDDTGSPSLVGEKGYSTLERIWLRPTCEVNGLLSGYTGEGSKTVLPAKAMAKVSFRLVPDQDPHRIRELLEKHVAKHTPAGVTARVVEMHGGNPWRARIEGPLYTAGARALEAAFGEKVVYAGEGGSIPIVSEFEKILGAPVLLMGFGLPGENAHAPDEWMSVENYEKGTDAAASLLTALSEAYGRS